MHVFPYSSQSNSGCGETNESSVTGVRLVNSIGIIMTELVYDFGDSIVIVCGKRISDQPFKPVPSLISFLLYTRSSTPSVGSTRSSTSVCVEDKGILNKKAVLL